MPRNTPGASSSPPRWRVGSGPIEDPIGQSVRCCRDGDNWDRVVGVTGEVHGNSLDTPPDEIAYFAIVPPDSAPTNNLPLDVHMVIKAPNAERSDNATPRARRHGGTRPECSRLRGAAR